MIKEKKHIEQHLELLNKVSRSEVSPFLKTRIDEITSALETQIAQPKMAWSIAISFAIILVINILVMKNTDTTSSNNGSSYTIVNTNNTLY